MSRESPESMNPNALPLEDAARLLTKVGGREISVDVIYTRSKDGKNMRWEECWHCGQRVTTWERASDRG